MKEYKDKPKKKSDHAYSDHAKVLQFLKDDQEAQDDLRQQIEEEIHFLHHPQGQWETTIWQQYEGRPRYTFDQMKAAISKAWAEMAANEYTATTQPVGGGADEDISNIYDGLIRAINNISSFDDISTKAGKRMIATGFSAWRVVAKYVDESFYQDLVVIPIHDCHRRVWFDCNAEMQTMEDANHVFVLSEISMRECKKKWGKGDRVFESVDSMRQSESYTHKPKDRITVGEVLYKKPYTKTIYLIDDEQGSVVDDDGLKKLGLAADDAVDKKDIECVKVYSRKFDGHDWLDDEKETVFDYLPVIPEFANFDIIEGKVTFEGLVRPRMDGQRVFNYVESRKVEEAILAPRAKLWVDDRATDGYEDELADLNRDPRAVQQYNGAGADKAMGRPFLTPTPGAQINPALSELSQDMIRNMQLTTGQSHLLEDLQASRRDSDFRFDQRGSMGQMGTFEYYRSHSVALEHTAKVLLRAIPRVYDTERKIRTIDEAGQSSEVTINQNVNGQILNNLTVGKYDICVKVGPTFENRQTEANTRILELGDRIPEVVALNADIIASNIDAPGMQAVADRLRVELFKAGKIPESQWTDEEKEQAMAAAQNPPPPDPAAMIAEAEQKKAETELLIKRAELEQKQQSMADDANARAIELQIKAQAQEVKNMNDTIRTLVELYKANNEELIQQQEAVVNRQQDSVVSDQ